MTTRILNVLPVVLFLAGCGGADFTTGGAAVDGDSGPEGLGGSGSAPEGDAAAAGASQGGGSATGGVTGVTGGAGGVTAASGGAGTGGDQVAAGGAGNGPGAGGAGSGGDPGGTGGKATGGQQTGTGGNTGGGGALAGDAGGGCRAPYSDQLVAAAQAALPTRVVWTSFDSMTGTAACAGGYSFAACGPLGGATPTPNCGALVVHWTSVSVLPDGDIYATFSAQVNTAAKYGCSGAISNSCSIEASTSMGALKIHVENTAGAPALAWKLSAAQSLTTWGATSTCPGFDGTAAGSDLNAELVAAMPTDLSASCQ